MEKGPNRDLQTERQSHKRSLYSEEYRENVIQLATSGDRTPRQVAKDLEIPRRTLYTWLQVRGLTGTNGLTRRQDKTG